MPSVASRRALGRIVFASALVCVSFASVAVPATAADQKKVLVLYSVRRDTQLASVGDRKLPGLLEAGLEQKPDFYSEYIDSARFPDPEYTTGTGSEPTPPPDDLQWSVIDMDATPPPLSPDEILQIDESDPAGAQALDL